MCTGIYLRSKNERVNTTNWVDRRCTYTTHIYPVPTLLITLPFISSNCSHCNRAANGQKTWMNLRNNRSNDRSYASRKTRRAKTFCIRHGGTHESWPLTSECGMCVCVVCTRGSNNISNNLNALRPVWAALSSQFHVFDNNTINEICTLRTCLPLIDFAIRICTAPHLQTANFWWLYFSIQWIKTKSEMRRMQSNAVIKHTLFSSLRRRRQRRR